MRASAIRMGVDPIEAIPFFRNVEQRFDVYDVPAELRPVLVRPFHTINAVILLSSTLTFRLCADGVITFFVFFAVLDVSLAVNLCINCSFLHLLYRYRQVLARMSKFFR